MISKAIRDYLTEHVATPVYYSQVVAEPDTVVTILDYFGFPPDIKFNYDYPRFQVRVRAPTYDDAYDVIQGCYNILQNAQNITISGMEIIEIKALQSPYMLELDEKNRVVFQQNFETMVYLQTANRE